MTPFLQRAAACLVLAVLGPAAVLRAEERVPWTTSAVTGSPETPPPLVAEVVWPHLTFQRALDLALLESEQRLFVVEERGKIWILPSDLAAAEPERELCVDLKTHIERFQNVRGLTFHPDFPAHRQAFLHYNILLEDGRTSKSWISRFTLDEHLRLDPESEERLLTFGGNGHNGGNLQFGPDGMLYFGVGDLDNPSPPDIRNVGQDLRNLASTIVRIDVDRKNPGLNYAVPKDNPFRGVPGARPEIWAFGFRNPWKIAFHPANGSLWTGDVGWDLWEMVIRVERGGNYGWPIMEGPSPMKTEVAQGPAPIAPPTLAYSHAEGASVTGGFFVHSPRLPELAGAYLYGDFVTGRVWALWHDGKEVTRNVLVADTRKAIVSFGQAPGGDLLFLDWPDDQHLRRFVPNPARDRKSSFPRRLSKTGIFADAKNSQPAPGVHEFEIKAPMWLDGAVSDYWLGVPGTGTIRTKRMKRRGAPVFAYDPPEGTVLAKTISREGRRIETQLLHFDGRWNGYSYRWNDTQDDAELVPAEGADAMIAGRPWRFHSRAECMRCHQSDLAWPLAFQPGQLDRDGQVQRFRELALVDDAFAKVAADIPFADPRDESAPLERRARSWLHTNCVGCHRNGGGGGTTVHLNAGYPNEKMDLLGAVPGKGTFGIANAFLVAPGDPTRSVLAYRIATPGTGHMPLIGARTVDRAGVATVMDWIASLDPSARPAGSAVPPGNVAEALALYRRSIDPQTEAAERQAAVDAAQRSENSFIQNLFLGLAFEE